MTPGQLLRAMANGRGYPLLLLNRYGKEGVLYVWTMPENFNDLYRMPQSAISTVKNYVMAGFPVRLDGPDHVALFAYDNNTCIVESFLPHRLRREGLRGPPVHQTAQPGHRRSADRCRRPRPRATRGTRGTRRRADGAAPAEARSPPSTSTCCPTATAPSSPSREDSPKPMPTYEYTCSKCGHSFEKVQSIKEDALTVCPRDVCPRKRWGKGKVIRRISAGGGLIFKGSGFYETDYRSENYKAAEKKEMAAQTPAKTETKTAPSKDSAAGKSGGPDAAAKPSPAPPATPAAEK